MTNPYASAAQQVADEDRQSLASSAIQARDTTPEQTADILSLSGRSGIPAPVVRTDPETVRGDLDRQELESLRRESPIVAQWASEPDNFALARDDFPTLRRLSLLVDVPRAVSASVPRTVGSTLSGGGELLEIFGRRASSAIQDTFGLEPTMRPLRETLFDPFKALDRAGTWLKGQANFMDVPAERQNIVTDIFSAVGQLGTQVVQAVVAPPTLMPSLLSQGADQMAERVAEADMQGTGAGDLATVSGAAVTGLLERFGITALLKRVPPKIRNDLLRKVADITAAGGIEAAQETVEGLAQDLMTRALLDEDYAIGEGLEREAIAAGGAGSILRLITQGVAGRRGAREAQAERSQVDAMVETAAQSKLRERAPQAFESLVEQAAGDKAIFLPLGALETYYGDRTAQAVATLTGDPNAYAEAQETGAELTIPLARYVSIVKPDAHAAFAEALRMQPGQDVRHFPSREAIEADIQAALAEARGREPEGLIGRAARALGFRPEDAAPVSDTPDAPLITDPTLMEAESFAEYQAAIEAAQQAREQSRQAERLREQQAAQQRLAKRERAAIQTEVEAELRTHPVYKAQAMLRHGVPDAPSVKLDHQAVVDAYGQDVADRLQGLTRKRDGVSPDEAAGVLGYQSGAKLIHDLTTAPAFADMVRIETDARMQAREPVEPDASDDDGIDAQAAVMLREIQALERRAGGIRTHDAVLREVSRRLIAGKDVVNVRPVVYRAAADKAGREAFHEASRMNWNAAAAARRRQLQSLYLFREARNAREEATRAGRFLASLTRKSARATIGKAGEGYLEQIDGVLTRFDFRPLSGRQMTQRQGLGDFVRAKAEQGIIIDLPPTIADETFRVPFRRLKVGELRELRDAVQHLVHQANEANLLRVGNEAYDRRVVDESMAMSVRDGHKLRPPRAGDPTLGDRARRHALQGRALTATGTDAARELDGFKDGGAVWDHTVRVIRRANGNTNAELRKAHEALAAVKLQHYTRAELRGLARDKVYIPEVGESWSRGRMLALALNWGNSGNREAVLEQAVARLSPEQVGVILGRLDARDWAFVQDVWTLIDSHWPAIAEAQKRRTGLVPEKVPRSPFHVRTADGQDLTLEGGYYPLKFESDSVKTLRESEGDFYDDIRIGRFAKAATRNGHTIERIGSGGRTVRLDLGVVSEHLRNVVRDVHLGDAVNFVHQAIHGKEFGDAARDTGNVELVRGLEYWLKDVASGEIAIRRLDEVFLRVLRSNFTAAVLTWKVSSAALQITGLLQSAVVLGKGPMLDGVKRITLHPVASYRHAVESSEFMRQRMTTHVEAVQRVLDAEAGRLRTAQAAMIRHGYWMISRVQAIVDVSTWIAAERVGLEKFGDPDKARDFADDVVSRAQASGDWIDKNAVQRGTLSEGVRQTEWIRSTTALQSYMIAKWNAAYERTRVTDFRDMGQGLKWAADMTMLLAAEGMVAAIIRGNWPDDEEDDGSTVDDWMLMAGEEGVSSLLGGLPGLSQAVDELRGYDSKGVYSEAWGAVGNALEQTAQGEWDKARLKSYITATGYATGIPSGQINKTIDAMEAANKGREVTPYEYLVGPAKD